MGFLDFAWGNSICRGYDYFLKDKVVSKTKISDTEFIGKVSGSIDTPYDVYINLESPKESHCNCPIASTNHIICKHQVALYFSFFPKEAEANPFILVNKKRYNELPFEILDNYDVMIKLIAMKSIALEYASENLKKNKDFVIEAVKCNCFAIRYVPECFKFDFDVNYAAALRNSQVLAYIPKELLGNKEFMIELIKHNGFVIKRAPKELLYDEDFLLTAIMCYSGAIEYIPKELLGNKEFMTELARQNGFVIKRAPKELLYDEDFLLTAIRRHPAAIEYIPDELKTNKDFICRALKISSCTLKYLSSDIKKTDKTVVLAVVEKNGLCLENVADELKGNKEITLAAVKQNGLALKYVADE